MFVGSIDNACRRFFKTQASVFTGKTCVVGCSGNFTFEQLLTRYSEGTRIVSNDVSIYSCAVGSWLTHTPFSLKLADPDFDWLEPYIIEPVDKVATIMLLLKMLEFQGQKNDYQRGMWQHFLSDWKQYHADTVLKISDVRQNVRCDEFNPCDVFEVYKKYGDDPNVIYLSFMPTYKGGYERIYKRLMNTLTWDAPTYDMLDDERRDEIYDFLTQRNYIIYDDREIDLPLAFIERKGGGGRDVFIYSNQELEPMVLGKHRNFTPGKYKFIGPDDEITPKSRIDFHPCDNKTINYYREMFLAKGIAFADGQLPLLCFVDGKLFGFMLFAQSKYGDTNTPYMLSDFAVPYSRYSRLSKLVLYLSRTKDVQKLIQDRWWLRVKRIRTTAFTKRPSSMKYRGVYEVEKKSEDKINYIADAGSFTVKEAKKLWLDKFSRHLKS